MATEGNTSPESFGRWAEAQACAGGGGAGPLVDSGARACFAYRPSNHRDNHESLHRNGGQGSARIECRDAGAQSRVTFARRACARVRAWKAYVCACVRAVRRSGQGGSPSPRQVTSRIQQPISSSTFCLSGEIIPTESAKFSSIGVTTWQAVHLFMTRSFFNQHGAKTLAGSGWPRRSRSP